MISEDKNGSTWKYPDPPQVSPPLWDEWVGTHRLAVWSTAGTLKPDSISVPLFLQVPDVVFKAPPCQIWTCPPDGPKAPMIGWTTRKYEASWFSSFAHDPSSQAAERPGALLIWKPRQRQLTLLLGNSGTTTDSGVLFYVFTIAPDVMTGRWVDGGIGVYGGAGADGYRPQGYFCLSRHDSE